MVLEEKALLLKEELEASNEKVTLLTHDSEMLQQQVTITSRPPWS